MRLVPQYSQFADLPAMQMGRAQTVAPGRLLAHLGAQITHRNANSAQGQALNLRSALPVPCPQSA